MAAEVGAGRSTTALSDAWTRWIVPAAQVIPFRSDLDWATLGAVPEMLQTS